MQSRGKMKQKRKKIYLVIRNPSSRKRLNKRIELTDHEKCEKKKINEKLNRGTRLLDQLGWNEKEVFGLSREININIWWGKEK